MRLRTALDDRFAAAMLRRSVGALTADALDARCADCHRTPLCGEHVYHYDGGALVCELCRALRPGEPRGRELVRHSEAGHTVKLTRR
jgi:hypothetical protein